MSEYVKVEGHTSLARDEQSRKENYKKQAEEINNIKSDMTEIKNILNQIVEKING